MKSVALVLSLALSTGAFAADMEKQLKPANEYCFVWVGDETGNFVDRIEKRFPLDNAKEDIRRVDLDFKVDEYVRAWIYGGAQGYRMAIYEPGKKERALATGFYNRTGEILDFNTTGFELNTATKSYSIACVTESYIE